MLQLMPNTSVWGYLHKCFHRGTWPSPISFRLHSGHSDQAGWTTIQTSWASALADHIIRYFKLNLSQLIIWFPHAASPHRGHPDVHLLQVWHWLGISTSYNLTSKNYPLKLPSQLFLAFYFCYITVCIDWVKWQLEPSEPLLGRGLCWVFHKELHSPWKSCTWRPNPC